MITVCFHPTRARLELAFPGKPDARTRTQLKEAGFAWNPAAQVWHLAKPPCLRFVRGEPVAVDGWKEALDLCRDLARLTPEHIAALNDLRNFALTQAGERGMEAACGIS